MSETGAVYAKALFELAEETNAEEQMLSDLVGVTDLLKREPEYVRLMDSYAIPKKERVALLDKAFSGQVSELTLNLMKILVEENALFLLPDCRKAFKKLYNEKQARSGGGGGIIEMAGDGEGAGTDAEMREYIDTKSTLVRWAIYLALFAAVLIFGIYGPGYDASVFIYREF